MIYDCFLFCNEIDLLKIRLEELKDVVNKFVLVEATKTISGRKKPLYFLEYKHEFKEYIDRIVYYVVRDMPRIENNNRWPLERHQRNCISKALLQCNCNDDDVILLSDVDEIPKAAKVNEAVQLLEKHEFIGFQQKRYLYYLNCILVSGDDRICTVACRYRSFKRLTPNIVRWGSLAHNNMWWSMREIKQGKDLPEKNMSITIGVTLPNAGSHLAWLGGYDAVLYKQQNHPFGESLDKTAEKGGKYIKYNVCRTNLHNKKALLSYKLPPLQLFTGQSETLECTKIYHDRDFEVASNLPEYLKANKEKYKHFFKFAIPYDEKDVRIQTFGWLYNLIQQIMFKVRKYLQKPSAEESQN